MRCVAARRPGKLDLAKRTFGTNCHDPTGKDNQSESNDDGERYVSCVLEIPHDVVPGVTKRKSQRGKSRTPNATAESTRGDEATDWHLDESGSKRDEGTDDGNEATKDDDWCSVSGKKTASSIDVGSPDQYVFPEPFDNLSTAVAPYSIAKKGPTQLADGGNQDDQGKLQVDVLYQPSTGQGAGEGNSEFCAERDAGGRHDAHEEESQVSPMPNELMHLFPLGPEYCSKAYAGSNRATYRAGGGFGHVAKGPQQGNDSWSTASE